jgi:acetylglutamate kinase
LGLVGEITAVNLEPLRSSIAAGALPVLTCLGESVSGQVLNVNADIAARELVWALQPHKIIFLTPAGGLLDRDGRVISAVSLNNDYEALMREPWVHSGMRLKLQQIFEMLMGLDESASVSITSADQLARELFTYRGAGTLVRRGEDIRLHAHADMDVVTVARERIEQSFGRSLRVDWWASLVDPVILLSASHRAVAVVTRGVDGLPYLDKFVVTPDAQGEGLGAALWQVLRAQYPGMYWRSRNNNPITGWYFQQADSSDRCGPWVVFTIGLDGFDARAAAVHDAMVRDSGWEEEP